MPAVPAMIAVMVASPLVKPTSSSSVHLVWRVGRTLDKITQQKMVGVLSPDARIAQVYGMREVGRITSFTYSEGDASGSLGRQFEYRDQLTLCKCWYREAGLLINMKKSPETSSRESYLFEPFR
ncbi:hypothetical protein PHISCL_03272 [Aspergillus sclerotialis]|uniref:Uncharacterized protein n=1 Tax=Aspergillus sclerotialis TaxID=2070753 RepID=A0A3A2ZQ18_9EURO|nr:hypothetical protein PHISCL_03272 [Aspergillus sclerotialis]